MNETEDFSGFTVLVVEDEELNFLYIKRLLENNNISLIHAKNGKEAVEICKEDQSINFILMDINMPVMNGYEATRIIKKNLPDMPIFALTALKIKESRVKAFNAGCDNYFTKPLSENLLLSILKKLLHNYENKTEAL